MKQAAEVLESPWNLATCEQVHLTGTRTCHLSVSWFREAGMQTGLDTQKIYWRKHPRMERKPGVGRALRP